jgi:hypothetical protein
MYSVFMYFRIYIIYKPGWYQIIAVDNNALPVLGNFASESALVP